MNESQENIVLNKTEIFDSLRILCFVVVHEAFLNFENLYKVLKFVTLKGTFSTIKLHITFFY